MSMLGPSEIISAGTLTISAKPGQMYFDTNSVDGVSYIFKGDYCDLSFMQKASDEYNGSGIVNAQNMGAQFA